MKTPQHTLLESDNIIHIEFDSSGGHLIMVEENHVMSLQKFLRSKKIQSAVEFHANPVPHAQFPLSTPFCMKVALTTDRSKLFAYVTDYLLENKIPFERDDHSNTFILLPV